MTPSPVSLAVVVAPAAPSPARGADVAPAGEDFAAVLHRSLTQSDHPTAGTSRSGNDTARRSQPADRERGVEFTDRPPRPDRMDDRRPRTEDRTVTDADAALDRPIESTRSERPAADEREVATVDHDATADETLPGDDDLVPTDQEVAPACEHRTCTADEIGSVDAMLAASVNPVVPIQISASTAAASTAAHPGDAIEPLAVAMTADAATGSLAEMTGVRPGADPAPSERSAVGTPTAAGASSATGTTDTTDTTTPVEQATPRIAMPDSAADSGVAGRTGQPVSEPAPPVHEPTLEVSSPPPIPIEPRPADANPTATDNRLPEPTTTTTTAPSTDTAPPATDTRLAEQTTTTTTAPSTDTAPPATDNRLAEPTTTTAPTADDAPPATDTRLAEPTTPTATAPLAEDAGSTGSAPSNDDTLNDDRGADRRPADSTPSTTAAREAGDTAPTPVGTGPSVPTSTVVPPSATATVIDLRPAEAPVTTEADSQVSGIATQQPSSAPITRVVTESVQPVRIAEAIAPELVKMRGTTASRVIEIRLDPPDLGTVELEIRSTGSTITIVAVTESADATNAVLRQRDQIEATLRSMGMDLDGFDVDTGDARRGDTESRRASTPSRNSSSPDDLAADLTAASRSTPEGSVFL